MMHRMRIDDFKFKQIATGVYPKPEHQMSELSPEVKSIYQHTDTILKVTVNEAAMNDLGGDKSPKITLSEEKIVNKSIS